MRAREQFYGKTQPGVPVIFAKAHTDCFPENSG
jgi:hypothetical protein